MQTLYSKYPHRDSLSFHGLLQVDHHHHAGLHGGAEEGDETHPNGNGEVVSQQLQEEYSAAQRKGYGEDYMRGFSEGVVGFVEQQEDDQEHDRDDEFQPFLCTDLVFVLPAPFDVIAGRHFHFAGHSGLRLVHEPANVAPPHVHQYAPAKKSVLATDHGRSHHNAKVGHLSQRNLGAIAGGDQHVIPKLVGVMAKIRGIPHPHGESLATINRGCEVLAANRSLDHVLYVAYVDSVASGGFAIYFDFQIRRTGDALGIQIRDARNRTQSTLDFSFLLLDGREIVAEDLHSDLRADPGRKHVDAGADRLGPDVGHAGQTQILIQPLQDRFFGCPIGPFVLGFEVDDRFSHVHWCRLNGAFSATDFTNNALDERVLGDELVLPAKNLGCLGQGNAGVGNGHE